MTRTRALLSATFCVGLDALIHDYFAGGPGAYLGDLAEYGVWEACEYHATSELACDAFSGSCMGGWFDQAVMIANRTTEPINSLFVIACMDGDMRIIAYLIAKGANNWNEGLLATYYNDRVDIAELMYACGASPHPGVNSRLFKS